MARQARDFLPLHPVELRILLALVDGPSYGTRIVNAIEERLGSDTKIYPANLYRRIRNLLSEGLIAEAPAPSGADPRRSYLRITQLGREVTAAEARRLRELVADLARHEPLAEGS